MEKIESSASGDENFTYCDHCLRPSDTFIKPSTRLMKCSGCKKVSYCDKECQKGDWKHHKKYCKSLSAGEDDEPFKAANRKKLRESHDRIQQALTVLIPEHVEEFMDAHEALINNIFIAAILKPGIGIMDNYVILLTGYKPPKQEEDVGGRFPVLDGFLKSKADTLSYLGNDIGSGKSKHMIAKAQAAIFEQARQAEEIKRSKSKLIPPAIIFMVVQHLFPGPIIYIKPILSGRNDPKMIAKWPIIDHVPGSSSKEKLSWLEVAKKLTNWDPEFSFAERRLIMGPKHRRS